MYTLATTRFTNSTWETNKKYRENNNISGCIYGSPQEMSPKILYDSLVFVVEMNNDTDNIEGIGLVRNRPYLDKYYNIYKDGNYNRFVYKSNYRLDRNKLWEYNRVLVKVLDYILFGEKTHLKRGCGFTTITTKFLASKTHRDCKKLVLCRIINTIIGYFKKEYSIIDDIRIETDEKIILNKC
jgi:hypothetical protein